MEGSYIDRLIQSIDNLSDKVEELSIKVKRLTNSNPFLDGRYDEFKKRNNL